MPICIQKIAEIKKSRYQLFFSGIWTFAVFDSS